MNWQVTTKFADIVSVIPLIILFLTSLLPLTVKVLCGNREPNNWVSSIYVLIGAAAAAASGFLLFDGQKVVFYGFSNAIAIDGLSAFGTVSISVLLMLAVIFSREHVAVPTRQYSEFLFLLVNSALGMILLTWSNDLILTFIAIEIMSLCLYLLIALSQEEFLSKEAAFKYFVLGSFGSAIFLFGVAWIYGTVGSTYLNKVLEVAPILIAENPLFIVGVTMVLVGFFFKVSIAPFHAWTPDVYEGAPTSITAFMASAVKVATFIAILRFVAGDFLSVGSGKLLIVLQWVAAATMVVGSVGALIQNSFKRMLAYSGIAHGGYIMMGVVAASMGTDSWRGLAATLFYLLSYAVMTMGAFCLVGMLEKKEGDLILIDEIRGLSQRHPAQSVWLAIVLFSMAGLPPTLGFFGKYYVFSAAIGQGLYWLSIWGAISAILGVYVYLRPIVLMYMKDENGVTIGSQYKLTSIITFAAAIIVLICGIGTQSIMTLIEKVVGTLG
jgi:NADH-quinone oxidoreductase subunit N